MMRAIGLVLGAFVAAALFIVAIRTISGEDTWICDHGQWVMHGKPIIPMPSFSCPVSTPTLTPSPSPSR